MIDTTKLKCRLFGLVTVGLHYLGYLGLETYSKSENSAELQTPRDIKAKLYLATVEKPSPFFEKIRPAPTSGIMHASRNMFEKCHLTSIG